MSWSYPTRWILEDSSLLSPGWSHSLEGISLLWPQSNEAVLFYVTQTPCLHISIWHQWTEAAFRHQSLDILHTIYNEYMGLLFCNQTSLGYKSTPHGSALLPWPSVRGTLWDLAFGGWQLSVKWWALCICDSWEVASSSTYLEPYVKHRTDNK